MRPPRGCALLSRATTSDLILRRPSEARPSRRMAAGLPLHLPAILRVADVLQPLDVLAVERLLEREVRHAVLRRGAVPVLLARRDPHDVAWPDLADRLALELHAAEAAHHVQRLAERMPVPRGARPGLERHERRADARGVRRLDDRLLPHRAGERVRRPTPRRPRSAFDDVHAKFLPAQSSLMPIRFTSSPYFS